MNNLTALSAAMLLACAAPLPALAQASCSSDGTPQPVAVFERFLNADCEACWTDRAVPAPSTDAHAVVLDWIVPSPSGDDAPLSAAASRDALARLQSLGRAVPRGTDVHVAVVDAPPAGRVRVAHGLPFNDYLGTAIAWKPGRSMAASQPTDFYLLLVEAVPAGAEGTTVARNLVRNMLQGKWDGDRSLSKKQHSILQEMRSMRIPEGAQAGRLSMVGWVQDASGRILAAAQSVCR